MREFLKELWRFLRRRDSDSACYLIISLTEFLTPRDRIQMRDYIQAIHDFRSNEKD